MDPQQVYDAATRGIVNLQQSLTVLPVGGMNGALAGASPFMMPLAHGHFVTYGGGLLRTLLLILLVRY